MRARSDLDADLHEVGVHGFGVGVGHDHGRADATVRTDGAEDVGRDMAVAEGVR
jgi:hypothetical protein